MTKKDAVSRRAVVGAIGAGAAVSAARLATLGQNQPEPQGEASRSDAAASAEVGGSEAAQATALELLTPLTAGSRLGRWHVERVLPFEKGAVSVILRDAGGTRFQLDVCARDAAPKAERGPGHTEFFEVSLANNGDGQTATHEEHGLAAMALADVIRENEQHVERGGFATLAERVAAQSACVHVT